MNARAIPLVTIRDARCKHLPTAFDYPCALGECRCTVEQLLTHDGCPMRALPRTCEPMRSSYCGDDCDDIANRCEACPEPPVVLLEADDAWRGVTTREAWQWVIGPSLVFIAALLAIASCMLHAPR